MTLVTKVVKKLINISLIEAFFKINILTPWIKGINSHQILATLEGPFSIFVKE